ncbi:MAG: hypothetical protein V4449_00605 [Patescibacteria group bacterium]
MKLVNDFLARFQNLTPPDDAIRRAVASSVSFIAKVPVKKEDISISNNVAFVKCSSIAKSAIQVARGAILAELFQEIPKARNIVRDIR